MKFRSLTIALVFSPLALLAYETKVPQGAVEVYSSQDALGDFAVGKFTLETTPVITTRAPTSIRAWRVDDDENYLEIMDALVANAKSSGLTTVFQCIAAACGGFDFRYGIRTAPMPEFQVDLENFRYVYLEGENIHVDFFTSRFAGDTYIQERISHASAAATDISVITVPIHDLTTAEDPAPPPFDIETVEPVETVPPETQVALKPVEEPLSANAFANSVSNERLILDGLRFPSGSSELEADPNNILLTLAETLRARPSLKVYLVGHSDNTGGLAANKSLSLARANSVKAALIRDYQIDSARIFTEGVGFLAPIASNSNEEGKATNRRVEAVFIE